METNFDQLVVLFNTSIFSPDVLQQITALLKQQTDESLSFFALQVYQSLCTFEHKIWQLFSQDSHEWFNHLYSWDFFQTLASFNKKLIFSTDNLNDGMKVSLFIPETIDQMNSLFEQIELSNNDNDPFITFVSLWLDNLSFFAHEYYPSTCLPIIIHINQYLAGHFILSENSKFYLNQLRQPELSPEIFTAKQLFHMKSVPFSLNVYFCTNPSIFDYTPEQILQNIGDEYLQVIQVQYYTIDSWSKDLLACITHFTGFMRSFLWWKGETGTKFKILFRTDQILCKYTQAIIHMIDYQPHYRSITSQWITDETILIDSVLLCLMNIVQSQTINWFFRSMTRFPDILLKAAESSAYYRIHLCAYGILSEILTDDHLKELKITDNIRQIFFSLLEQAWCDPSKKYKQIPISYFLRGFSNLAKNSGIQEGTANSNKISLFIEMCDQYPIAFDIIWALSFNQDIQHQLRSNASFLYKLVHLARECDNEQMRKTVHGILWNLEVHHEDRSTPETNNAKTFDIMISYSHKEKLLCKQLYDELVKAGYHVWIDFDQMHGNVMDAMAQAIERSHTIIICMSEQYRLSNYCRAEAHYAFQRQRKIVPVLLQKHYKPDGWLLFLIGHLLYVDFNKHEFPRAMQMLFKELKTEDIPETPVQPKHDTDAEIPIVSVSSPKASTSQTTNSSILEWTPVQVKDWLTEHNLVQMSCLLAECDGRSLVYLSKYMRHGQPQQILSLLQEDALRRLKQSLSLIELSRFHSLIDQQRRLLRSTMSAQLLETSIKTDTKAV